MGQGCHHQCECSRQSLGLCTAHSPPPPTTTTTASVENARSLFSKPGSSSCCLVTQSCLTLCDPMDCSPSGTSIHGDSPGKKTGVGYHSLLQGISPNQGSNPGLPHCRWIVYRPSHQPPWKGSSSTRPLNLGTGHRAQAWWPPVPSQRVWSPSFKLIGFTYLFLAALDLRCFSRAFSSCDQQGILFVAALKVLRVVASLVEEPRL